VGRITDARPTRLIGAHTVDNGGIHMAARRAGAAGMRALQIFTAIPKYYGDKSSIRPERVTRFRETLAQVGIAPEHVVVHAAYVLNTATTDEEKWGRASAGLRKELERSTALGVGGVCFHPGAATGGDRAEGVARVARAMTAALEAVPGVTRVVPADGRGMVGGFEVDSQAGRDVRRELARTVVTHGWGLLELRPVRMSLEEIFLSLTTDESRPPAEASVPVEEVSHE